MLAKAKAFPLLPARVASSPLVQNIAVVLAVNWLCQGMRGMGRRELAGRLAGEAILALLFGGLLLAAGSPRGPALAGGVVVAHTLAFLFNGQLWVCMRYWPRWRPDAERTRRFLARTVSELRDRPWLREAVCIGSRGAGAACGSERSDLDLRLVFPRGASGFLRTHALLVRLRSRALFAAVPLDLYADDDPEALARHRTDEVLGVLLDRDGRLARRYRGERHLVFWP